MMMVMMMMMMMICDNVFTDSFIFVMLLQIQVCACNDLHNVWLFLSQTLAWETADSRERRCRAVLKGRGTRSFWLKGGTTFEGNFLIRNNVLLQAISSIPKTCIKP
jgi:hypothetical protein